MLATSCQESSFPLTSGRETSDPGEIRFEVPKFRTSSLIAHISQTRGSSESPVFSLSCEGTRFFRLLFHAQKQKNKNKTKTKQNKTKIIIITIIIIIIIIIMIIKQQQRAEKTESSRRLVFLPIIFIAFKANGKSKL